MTAAALIHDMMRDCPFHRLLGIEVLAVDASTATARLGLAIRSDFRRSDRGDGLHGGVIAALMDVAAACAVRLASGRGGMTVGLSVDYLRPVMGDRAEALGRVIRAGRGNAWADVELFDAEGRLSALGRGRFVMGAG